MFELRRFSRSRLTRAAVAAVVVLPLLYAGLYLWSFWDPQGHLDRIPVALVMQDEPATADGRTLHAGRDLAEELRERKIFDWREATAREAADGVRDGGYYLSLTIPADFSARLSSPSKDGTPSPAELGVRVDTGRSYIMGTISDAVFEEVRTAAARTATHDYFDNVFLSIGDIHDKTGEAAEGAGELHEGANKAGKGADRLAGGLGSAQDGARELTVGLNSANSATGKLASGAERLNSALRKAEAGVGELRKGLDKLHEGAGTLADGTRQAYDKVHANTGKVNTAADEYVPVLNEWGPKVADAADVVANAADRLGDGLGGLSGEISQGAERTQEEARAVQAYLDGHPDADPELRGLLRGTVTAAQGVAGDADRLEERVSGREQAIADLRRDAQELARGARKVAEVAPGLGTKVDALREQYVQLDEGLAKLAEGAATLDGGIGKAATSTGTLSSGVAKISKGSAELSDGLGKLGGGLVRLGDGAARLDSGVGRLQDGAGELSTGLGKLDDGSKALADGLADGAAEIPSYGTAEREGRADMMSDPVRLATTVDNEVPNYGTGFAPFFVPLALWVGAMIAYMVLRPLNPRLLAGTASAVRVALSGWLPAFALGAAQVGVLLAVLRYALGLEVAHPAGMAAFLLLTAAAFLALVQAINALLGPPGRVAALALLMLQLTSAAGTYPIETSPGFFQTISPWLPMSWVVSALRRLISGGDLTVVWQACGVLTVFLLLGLALTVLAVGRGRTWSISRLHPELSL
ncbi:YhgE/Pip domain-containing protein [Nonomuraea sp. NPDC046570]|uniref:YhgE/Pip domain-containing protein n=1 Tax=Nonomuraea sp. NPDC046570 TaxID=3155255 RepID=UPI0033DF58DB